MSEGEEQVVIPSEEEVAKYGGCPAAAAAGGPQEGDEAAQAEAPAAPSEARQPESEWKEIALRARAELSNYQKRAQKDQAEALRYANGTLIKALLPVLDNLERVVQSGSETKCKTETLLNGVRLTLDMFQKVLREYQVEAIAAEGQPFDPQVHEAMMERPSDHAERTVLQELGKGYRLHERVLRPAKVIVSKPAATSEVAEGKKNDETRVADE